MNKGVFLGLAIAAAAMPAHAADQGSGSNNASVQQQLDALKQMVLQLQRRVDTQDQEIATYKRQAEASQRLLQRQLVKNSGGKASKTIDTDLASSQAGQNGDSGAGRSQANTDVASSQNYNQNASGAAADNATEIAGVKVGTGGHSRAQRQSADSAMSKDQVETIARKTYTRQQNKEVNFGGSARYNYVDAEFDKNEKRHGGDLNFAVFVLQASADIDNVLFDLDYRFYDYQRTLHNAWVGYRFPDQSQVEIGVMQAPFGLLPFASNNYFFSSNFYLGLEDDYDAGVKYSGTRGPVNYALAFFKNDEKGGSGSAQRYSLDPTNLPVGNGLNDSGNPVTDRSSIAYGDAIQEINTGVGRVGYTFAQDSDHAVEVAGSGRVGQIYNNSQQHTYGTNWAAALSLDGHWKRYEVMLQATRYEYRLDGQETAIGAAAYATNYPFASEGTTYIANISYTQPLSFGPFDSIKFYNDYSYVGAKSGGYGDTWQTATGALLAAGNIYTYFDLINGTNEPFVNGFMTGHNSSVQTLFNMNIGYYF